MHLGSHLPAPTGPESLSHRDDTIIEAILPCLSEETGDVIELNQHPSVLVAEEECQQIGGDNFVQIVDDPDVHQSVVELHGSETRLLFNCNSVLRYLVLFVKNLEGYFAFEIEMLDDSKKYRDFHITNSKSLARVHGNSCQMPLAFGKGGTWRYLCMDLHRMCTEAFGTHHVATVQVRVHASCRLLRAFFQDVKYSDAELPPWLALLE